MAFYVNCAIGEGCKACETVARCKNVFILFLLFIIILFFLFFQKIWRYKKIIVICFLYRYVLYVDIIILLSTVAWYNIDN